MSARNLILPLTVLLLALVVKAGVADPQTNIIVTDADTIREDSVSASQGLISLMNAVDPRIVLEYANTLREMPLAGISTPFRALLEQIAPRYVVQYANTLRHINLAIAPVELQTLLGQVSARVAIQYANTNRRIALVYPAGLIDDNAPPQISQLVVLSSGNIAWTTDEFATSAVKYGTQSNVYPWVISDPLFGKQHEVSLAGLTPGAMYYYKVESVDRNGNLATSSQSSFVAKRRVYLPLVLRK